MSQSASGAALPPTILVVDDDPWILELIKEVLAPSPCRVITLTDPVRALPLMDWEKVDVLVADISMPGVNGVDLIARARRLFPSVPRILLTAAPSLERLLRAVNEAEVYRVLVKPTSPKVLRETINDAVALRRERLAAELAQREGEERQQRLQALELEHAGLGTVATRDGVYTLGGERLRELEERYRGTPLGPFLPGPR